MNCNYGGFLLICTFSFHLCLAGVAVERCLNVGLVGVLSSPVEIVVFN